VHYGWYDSTEFWSLKAYKAFLQPRLQKEIELVHKHGAKFGYTMASGAMPLLGTLKEMGIDLLYGVDPVQGGYDMTRAKREIGDRICLWGGVNSHITLTLGSREDIIRAVKEAISIMGPNGGFILSSVGTMSYPQIPTENIEVMIEAWRGAADY
jgi:uroporphyrinogen decarboxylase